MKNIFVVRNCTTLMESKIQVLKNRYPNILKSRKYNIGIKYINTLVLTLKILCKLFICY